MKKDKGWGEVALLLIIIALWQVFNIHDKLTNPECHDNWFKVLTPTWGFALFIGMLWLLLKMIWFGSGSGKRRPNDQE